jgi:hypothetical protein
LGLTGNGTGASGRPPVHDDEAVMNGAPGTRGTQTRIPFGNDKQKRQMQIPFGNDKQKKANAECLRE